MELKERDKVTFMKTEMEDLNGIDGIASLLHIDIPESSEDKFGLHFTGRFYRCHGILHFKVLRTIISDILLFEVTKEGIGTCGGKKQEKKDY